MWAVGNPFAKFHQGSYPHLMNWRAGARSDMRFFYLLAFCYVGFFLFVIVNRYETNRLLANLLMFLLLGVTAAALLQELKPAAHSHLMDSGNHIQRSISKHNP